MNPRPPELDAFIAAAAAAFDRHATDPEGHGAATAIFAALAEPAAPADPATPCRLSACAHLPTALDNAAGDAALRPLVDRFRDLEPLLRWVRRPGDATASADFAEGHANAMIAGPGGLEPRRDVWLGVSLLAPHVRYPDHDHAPEEVYLVLSDGEFRQGDGDWFRRGIGGSFHNVPGILHAMRAGAAPLLALWVLRA